MQPDGLERGRRVKMAKREFTYRGKTLSELNSMSMDDVMKLLPARARRKMKRGFSEQEKTLLAIVRETRKSGNTSQVIRTHCRDMLILPEMVGLKFAIYSGKEFKQIDIQPEMIGHYLGEFSLTRVPVKHSAPGIGATRSSMFVPVK